MKRAEARTREGPAMRDDQCSAILLEARARECMGVASRKAKRKRERAGNEARGTKVP